jgi:cathepsin B
MQYGPISAAFDVYADFENYVSGVYHVTSKKDLGGHAVRIVGWGEEAGTKYWRVANSWNKYWYWSVVRSCEKSYLLYCT